MTLVLDERRHVRSTLRLWTVVWTANVVGTLLFALLVMKSSALSPSITHELSKLGTTAAAGGFEPNFWSGILAGWLLALVAWLVEAGEHVTGQIALIWLMTLVIGFAGLDHCVSTTAQVPSGAVGGAVDVDRFAGWPAATTFGNILGGTVIGGVANYGQVRAGGG